MIQRKAVRRPYPQSTRLPLGLDEEQIALCATMFLKRAGYRTLRAASGDQALEIFTDEVDAVLTDCAMPGLSGDKLAMLLLQRKPTLRALFMSGNEVDSIRSEIPLELGLNFIPKPFRASSWWPSLFKHWS